MATKTSHGKLLQKIKHLESELAACKERKTVLEASEDKYRCLFNNQNESVFVHPFEPSGFAEFSEVNDVACRRYGYTREEFMELTATDITQKEDSDHHARPDQRQRLIDQGHLTFEAIHLTKTGRRFPVEISSSITNIGDRKVILSVVRDITDRKGVEDALRESNKALKASEERYQIVSELTSDYAYAFRVMPKGEIVNEWVTNSFYRITGYDKKQMQSEGSWERLLFHEDLPIAIKRLESLVAGKALSVEYRIVTQGGDIRWMLDDARPVWDSKEDRVTRIFGAVKDITESKQFETERLELDEKLRQAQKMEAIGTLAGGIAHDFNNILAAVIGYSELSLEEIDPESKIAENLKQVVQAGIRAKDLVKQILTFARQANEDVEPVKVSAVAREVIKLLQSTLPTTVTIHSDIQCDSLVLANATQIHQIFMNLATNAFQAMEPKGGQITIAVKEAIWVNNDPHPPVNRSRGRYLIISIADTGKGIPEEKLSLVFEPYYTDKPKGKGTGLGLSVVHGITKKLGGMSSYRAPLAKGLNLQSIYPSSANWLKNPPTQARPCLRAGGVSCWSMTSFPSVIYSVKFSTAWATPRLANPVALRR